MNEIKTIDHRFEVGGDFFALMNIKLSKRKLSDYLLLFNIEEYFIFKATSKQRLVSIKEFLEFKYCGYILFKKDKYDKKHIENWLELLKSIGGIMFLSKPLPPFSPNKIIIK